jgi:hypothetical protein
MIIKSKRVLHCLAIYLYLSGLFASPSSAQITNSDLSVSASISPSYFSQDRRNTITLTVRNLGPDTIDTGTDYSVSVYGESYFINQSPAAYSVIPPIHGCAIERFITEPLPDNGIALFYAYYFDSLAPGESRSCTYDIEYASTAQAPVRLSWDVYAWYSWSNDDPNPANNVFTYTLTEAAQPATPVPALSSKALLIMALGLVVLACLTRRHAGRAVPGIRNRL